MAPQTTSAFRLPTRLVHGAGARHRLGEFLAGEKVLVVTDEGLVRAGVVEQVLSALDEAGIAHALFAGVVANPPARCAHAGQRLYQRQKCTAILAVGGGSPMDVAKMIGVLARHGGRIEQYLGADKVAGDIPPLVCLPTTYGTGSEVTPFAVLTNPRTRNKDPLISWKIAPAAALLDPELAVALPAAVGAPTGMDALTHAIESYVSLRATPLTEGMALAAIELVGRHLRRACANDGELAATESMLVAASLAGMAFAQTRLGNVHAMSHPVGARFGVHHGLANAVLLPWVMEFNLPARLEKFARIAAALGAPTAGLAEREAARQSVECVRQLNRDLGIPATLGECGVKRASIGALSAAAMQSGNIAVNPRKTCQEDIEALFRQAI